MNQPEYAKSMEGFWYECVDKVTAANKAAINLRIHLLGMKLECDIGLAGRFSEPTLIIYRERKVIPPVIKELVKVGWEGFQVTTAYMGKVVVKPAE